LLVYPQVEGLDVAGPSAVFAGANRIFSQQYPDNSPPYRIVLIAGTTAPLRTSDGLTLIADHSYVGWRAPLDTLLVAGSPEIESHLDEPGLVAAVRRLAAAGLLDGRRATTHWAYAARLAARYPAVAVDADPIYLRDGNVYSSAGVSAGMDLSIALVEEDLGRDIALEVARALVLYMRRPGGQAQFSTLLATQTAKRGVIADLQLWIADHLAEDLSVPVLAGRVAMSPRNFARVFTQDTGLTPARFVESLRVEAARRALEDNLTTVKAIAATCGFGTVEAMRLAFLRTVGIGPAAYRERFEAHH
jgi:transcriptional regulator GlxA family with amidase domain